MTEKLTLDEIAEKAEAYANDLGSVDALRFALRNLAMSTREAARSSRAGDRFEEGRRAGIEEAASRLTAMGDGIGPPFGDPYHVAAQAVRALASSPARGGGNEEGEKP